MKYVFLRDDDVFSLKEESFIWFWDLWQGIKLPIVYAVIPGKLDSKSAEKLYSVYRENPSLIDIAQHGYMHKNHNPEIHPKYEFGPFRSKLQQKNDILKGMELMRYFFGENLPKIFVPPFDGFDIVTLTYINKFGFDIFSADDTSIGLKYDFLNLPYLFAINDYDPDGYPIPMPFDKMFRKYAVFMHSAYKLIGILLHHKAYEERGSRKSIELFLKFLKDEEKKGNIKIILPSLLLKYRK